MTLYPFVFGNASHLSCFDESPPCKLEQTSMCAIKVAKDADKDSKFPGQSAYVPWLVCMDTNKDNLTLCNGQAGIDGKAIQECLENDHDLIQHYLQVDAPIHATPTVKVNGKAVGNGRESPTYSLVKKAICKADPTLGGCSTHTPTSDETPPLLSRVEDVLVV